MGIAAEILAARELGCWCDPFPYKGGDCHQGDLWKGEVSISLKSRGPFVDPDFLCPPGQVPEHFVDDYGVVARWVKRYSLLRLEGYFNRDDWAQHKTLIHPSKNNPQLRPGIPHTVLRPIEELKEILDAIPTTTVPSLAAYRHLADIRNGNHRTRSTVS